MKFKLRNNGHCWWVKDMIIEGEFQGGREILEIDSINICRLNKDIMSKDQIIECMKYPTYGFGRDYLECLETEINQLEKLLLIHQFSNGYHYIVKDKNGSIIFFDKLPVKGNAGYWYHAKDVKNCIIDSIPDLFTFISWRDNSPTLISDILNNHKLMDKEMEV